MKLAWVKPEIVALDVGDGSDILFARRDRRR